MSMVSNNQEELGMVMCAEGCTCRACYLINMAWHPVFRNRIDLMIQEYKQLLGGTSYFPIELTEQGANPEGRHD